MVSVEDFLSNFPPEAIVFQTHNEGQPIGEMAPEGDLQAVGTHCMLQTVQVKGSLSGKQTKLLGKSLGN